jgi:TldD protein
MKDLAELALDTAKSKGASYADIRICRYRNQYIFGRDKRIETVADTEDVGFGVRAIVNGAWGFASSYLLEKEEIQRIAAMAVEVARASSRQLTRTTGNRPSRRILSRFPWRKKSTLSSASTRKCSKLMASRSP